MKMRFLFILFTILTSGLSLRSSAQNISTICGNGTAAYAGDTGSAISAEVNTPNAVATDSHGNIYLADEQNNRIRKINIATGVITTIAGTGVGDWFGDSGLATAAHIQAPRAIILDDTGAIYFTDFGNNCIRRIDTFGYIHAFAGMHGAPGFSGDGGPATAAVLSFAWGIAHDHLGNFYIADQNNNRVRKVNAAGIISTIAGNGIAFYGGDGGPATASKVQGPQGVAVDHAGNIYIADYGNNRIRKINTSGIISTIAGSATYGFTGDGGPSTAAKLYYPRSVYVDLADNIYICDINNYRIRKINSLGIINTIVGTGTAGFSGDGGPATAAKIDHASGINVDFSGNVYISDNNNNRIRKIAANVHSPVFIEGHTQTVTICPGTELINLDTMLAVNDIDTGQSEVWSLLLPPAHGTAFTAYSTFSTGATMVPTSVYFTPSTYVGLDSFKVRVSDGLLSDTTTIYIDALPLPYAGVITGADSICPGDTTQLADTVAGGSWSTTNATVTVSATGLATGVMPGRDTIVYTWTGQCGTSTAVFTILVRSLNCHTGIAEIAADQPTGIKIYPEPNRGMFTCKVTSGKTEQVQVVVTNVMGEKVETYKILTNKNTELGLDVPTGLYYVTVIADNQRYTSKMTVTR